MQQYINTLSMHVAMALQALHRNTSSLQGHTISLSDSETIVDKYTPNYMISESLHHHACMNTRLATQVSLQTSSMPSTKRAPQNNIKAAQCLNVLEDVTTYQYFKSLTTSHSQVYCQGCGPCDQRSLPFMLIGKAIVPIAHVRK